MEYDTEETKIIQPVYIDLVSETDTHVEQTEDTGKWGRESKTTAN